ncbi:uncharacterized protein [Prorops nasuta]|uniref:uncharacterized protein n=1 Tax=Prorops nasuta TaxID=863751 RepID=UPI0034CFBEE8
MTKNTSLLMTAMIKVITGRDNFIEGRALLDTCSSAHFVTERFAKKLDLPMRPCTVTINSLGTNNSATKYSVNLTFKSNYSNFEKSLTFLTVPSIAESIPGQSFATDNLLIPKHLKLADTQFSISRSIDLLIGSGATVAMLGTGKINMSASNNDLYLHNTELGWVVVGGTMPQEDTKLTNCNLIDLSKKLVKFWELEEGANLNDENEMENACELHYIQHTQRDTSGRYIVRLPFRNNIKEKFEGSRNIALRRFHAIERKLLDNPTLREAYCKVMQEYIDLGHMTESRVECDECY